MKIHPIYFRLERFVFNQSYIKIIRELKFTCACLKSAEKSFQNFVKVLSFSLSRRNICSRIFHFDRLESTANLQKIFFPLPRERNKA